MKWKLLLYLVLSLLTLSLFGLNNDAKAASPYDNPNISNNLILSSSSCSTGGWNTGIDVSGLEASSLPSWALLLRDVTQGTTVTQAHTIYDKIQNEPENYYWAVFNSWISTGQQVEVLLIPKTAFESSTFETVDGQAGFQYYMNSWPSDVLEVTLRKNGSNCSDSNINNVRADSAIGNGLMRYTTPFSPVTSLTRFSMPYLFEPYSPTSSRIFFSNMPFTPPAGYDGPVVPDSPIEPEVFTPQFSWVISDSGKLTLTYLKNINPFLAGFGYVVINEMTTDWQSLGTEVLNDFEAPFGTFVYDWQIPAAGYYMARLSYDQTFPNSPPWSQPYPRIENVFIQFYWDGARGSSGTTTGCEGTICNPQKQPNSDVWNMFNALDGLNTFGLSAFLLAPINFLQTLPSMVNNCSPINMPILGVNVPIECLQHRYWEWNTPLMITWQTVINAIVCYWVALNVFRNVKNINSPHKDQIEVAHL